jgi:GT2 family glycosyltransferase/LmbE family N-acetylglucosaminyl deacetylase
MFEASITPFDPSDLTGGGRVLVLAPHPDDETFGCGGSLVKHASAGDRVNIVVVTKGEWGEKDPVSYAQARKKECLRATRELGISEESLEFWELTDRGVSTNQILPRLVEKLKDFRPTLIYAPSPWEIHPDHKVTAEALLKAIKSSKASPRVAFFEISHPLRVNVLVDITPAIEKKIKAIERYASQTAKKHYKDHILGLNRFRSLTLDPSVQYAEGFWVVEAREIQDMPLGQLFVEASGFSLLKKREGALVSVVARTKDRPALLREALNSLLLQTYRNLEVVVVNDGGKKVDHILQDFSGLPIEYVEHKESKGRAAAANAGLKKAQGDLVNFLDDDDLLYPDHVATLVEHLESTGVHAACTCAFEGQYRMDKHGVWRLIERNPRFCRSPRRYSLLVSNFLPFMTLMFRREKVLEEVGWLDGTFSIYEDWDFLIRMDQALGISHIPVFTAEYRFFGEEGGQHLKEEDQTYWEQRVFKKHKKAVNYGLWRNLANRTELEDFKQEMGLKDRHISNLEEVLSAREKEKQDLQKRIGSLEVRIHHLEVRIHHLEGDINLKENHIKNLERIIEEITSSRRWKLLTLLHNLKNVTLRSPVYLYKTLKLASQGRFSDITTKAREKLKPSPLILKKDTPLIEDIPSLEEARELLDQMERKPLISIIMPTYNTQTEFLRQAIASVKGQMYPQWELCIADDGSDREETLNFLKGIRDERIKIRFLSENGGISAASNAALETARGEYVTFLDHDDLLPPHALLKVALTINAHPEADIIYNDEDKIDEYGNHVEPFLKPDWSPDLFLSTNYVCHLLVYRKDLLDSTGGFRSDFDGSQDYDLLLRATEKTGNVYHIPHVLYHWRKTSTSCASDSQAKPEAAQAGIRALQGAMERRNIAAQILPGPFPTTYRVNYSLRGHPRVGVIIPNKDKIDLLSKCIGSLTAKTGYENYEIIIVDNGSREENTRAYYKELEEKHGVRILSFPHPFNFSAMNNLGAQDATGEYLLFLNNDIEIVHGEWMEALLEHSQRKEVGAVGAKLLFPDRKIQHAGVILGVGGVANHAFMGLPDDEPGYFGFPHLIRNVSAVTAACLMMRKEVFEEVGGFDETHLPVAFNDVDLCLRVRRAGYLIVYTPYAKLIHHESSTRGKEDIYTPRFVQETQYMKKKWGELLAEDPYYNPNLSLDATDFRPRR